MGQGPKLKNGCKPRYYIRIFELSKKQKTEKNGGNE
jgi:hypothetical protein